MPTPYPLLKLVQVSKGYLAAEGAPPLPVLCEVNWEIARGASVAVLGPSGSGKSTLLNLMGTLDRPDTGQVWLDGQDLSTLDERQVAVVRNQKIGFVFQAHHLLPHCTVWENVLVPTLAGGLEAALLQSAKEQQPPPPRGQVVREAQLRAAQRAERLLKRVGLADRLHHRPGQLSGGERQRVAVVRALVNQPALLLADEPTGSLDRASAGELGQLLVEMNREEDVTLVVVTHALELAKLMGRAFELRDGKLQELAKAAIAGQVGGPQR